MRKELTQMGGLMDPLLKVATVKATESLFETPQTAVHQAPLSMEFSRQEYWSALLFPFPGIEPE